MEHNRLADLNTQELLALLKDFYLLTGIKIAVFDSQYQEIIAYPDSHCLYCSMLRRDPACHRKCMDSNMKAFARCRKTSRITVYHCHAGLIEATAPLIDNGVLAGYIMFGQITDLGDDERLLSLIRSTFSENGITFPQCPDLLLQIERKSTEQIYAAAKILEACTFYVLFKHLFSLRRQNFTDNLNTYLTEHLSEELSVSSLCDALQISRSRLYGHCSRYLGTGIAQHIKKLRLEKAKQLLTSTELPVSQIASDAGFSDYNYFCRIFKKETGLSAKQFRSTCT